VVVGVACWKLPPGSNRKGSFQNDDGVYTHTFHSSPVSNLSNQRLILNSRKTQ
jgi:hypothetical protein